MKQEGQVRHFLDCWAEEMAGRGVEWGWRLLPMKAGQAGRQVYLVPWAAHDGREDRARRVVAREAGLHQPGAVVAHQGGGLLVVAHLDTASARSAGREWGDPRSVSVELAFSSPGRRGQSRGAGIQATSLPLGTEKEGWEEGAGLGLGLDREGERNRQGSLDRGAHPLSPVQGVRVTSPGPPRPFTFSPFHKLGSYFGPIPIPIPVHACVPAGRKSARDQGPPTPYGGL